MSGEFTCGDPAGLAGYLYDECDPAERAAIEAHLAACSRCASDLAGLGATRSALATWTPPEAKLGFRVASADDEEARAARVLRPSRWWQRPLPAWAQVAAALLIFGVGLGVGMRSTEPAPAPALESRRAAASEPAVSKADLAAIEERLRAEMNALRPARAAAPAPANESAVLERVRTLVADSEQRQQQELAVRLAQVMRDVDSQRRMDLLRIERTFGQMEGFMRPELEDQRQMINYMFQRTGVRSPQ